MNISFFLDVKLIEENKLYYTSGAVDFDYLNRYKVTEEDHLTVVCRKQKQKEENTKKLALASGENITFITASSYKEIIKSKNIKKVVKESDLCYSKLPSIIGLLSCKYINRYKKNQIVEVVGCPWDAMKNCGKITGKLLAPLLYIANKIYIKKAKNVIYVTNEFLQKRYPTKGKFIACSDVNIPLADSSILKKRNEKIKNQISKVEFGLIGSLDIEYKGHKTAIKAMSKLKDNINFELHFLGPGNQKKWKKLAKKYNVEENIKFDGTLPSGKKVFEWLDNIDIYLIPSYTEGLPRVLVEAMSRACPVIGSDVGGIPELIGKECVFKKKNSEELAKKILELLNNKDYMMQIAKKNYDKSKEFKNSILEKRRKNFIKSAIK